VRERERERERKEGRERERERERDAAAGRSRDGERMDQYRAIHAEVISLSTVSGGSRVAWRRGVARCWRGVAWRAIAPARSIRPAFSPLVFSLSPGLSRHPSLCVLSFFRVLRLDRSRSPSRPALTGVKIEPLWRASDSRTSLLAVLITLCNQC